MTSVSHDASSTTSTELAVERPIPWSPDAEQAVLGAMLLDQDAALKAVELLLDDAFYKEAHRRLFRAMASLLERNDALDPVVLRDELQRRDDLDAVGGIDYIAVLLDVVPTAANVEFHARIVKEKAILRRLIDVGTGIVQSSYDGRAGVGDLLDQAEQNIFEVSFQRGTQEVVRIKELMWDAMERIEARHRGDESIHGVASGFQDLDDMTNGFQQSDLIIVAARPSMGKTSFSLDIAANAAIDGQVPVVIFSLEMSREQLVERLLSSESFVDLQRLRTGRLKDEDFPRLSGAAGRLGGAKIWIDDTPALALLQLRSKARRMKAEHDIGLIIVDYLQLMQGPNSENRQQEISFISRSLKALARELRVPVMALSQLSRAPEQRGGDRRPMLSDLRDSGAIEQDADLVMFLYRADMYAGQLSEKDLEGKEGTAELILAKHRNGPTGTVTLAFNKQCTRFDSYSKRDGPPDAF
jgi:replicative DNA helicase